MHPRDLTARRFLVTIRDDLGFTEDVFDWPDLPEKVRQALASGQRDATVDLDGDGSYRAQLLPVGFTSRDPTAARAALPAVG